MNTLYLQPTDVLFFRDGRPMSGSLSGHGAAWPLPTVTNAALHAALHRAAVDGIINDSEGNPVKVHGHDHHRRTGEKITDAPKFGSLLTAGPFPVSEKNEWLFPRPLDANLKDSTATTFHPLKENLSPSSLHKPLQYPVANTLTATKDQPANWWDAATWKAYLNGDSETQSAHFKTDSSFSDSEHTYGIGIDPDTNTQNGEQFYSASYLRLKPGWKLGLLAAANDKINGDPNNPRDLVKDIFPNSNARTAIIAGGQQRICSVERPSQAPIHLPTGLTKDFLDSESGKYLVKWILLTPAIFPAIPDKDKNGNPMTPHPGGWLPNWIAEKNQTFEGNNVAAGSVLLLDGPGKKKAQRKKLTAGNRINATLVAALIDKPIPVTGYALQNDADPDRKPGPKSTHLAVPPGSVYYFECHDETAAQTLATALNWHGSETNPTTIHNRRSTLFGEKGFGLGLCGTWKFCSGKLPTNHK